MREYGPFEMRVYEQKIILKVLDVWNLEATLRWCTEYKNHINSIKTAPWAGIIDLSCRGLSIPDIWEYVEDVHTWANTNNQKYEIIICPLPLQIYVLERAHKTLTNVEIKFCNNLQEAYQWLENKV
jgi:hypothetical protein